MYEVYREPLNGFAPNSHGRRVWCLARRSLKVKVKGQISKSPGTKTAFFGPFGGLRAVMFGKTSLASSFLHLIYPTWSPALYRQRTVTSLQVCNAIKINFMFMWLTHTHIVCISQCSTYIALFIYFIPSVYIPEITNKTQTTIRYMHYSTACRIHRVSKNVPLLACYNFDAHEWILIFLAEMLPIK